ncbi:MAG: carbohydrate kinase family protein [Lachnospiraceae bacterium]|nr:carbohydrate kinase family protein [Lachnospiraceae bacterium]
MRISVGETMNLSVIGAANIDITATAEGTYRPGDSNPSAVSVSFGGVARNTAHNLCLLGHRICFYTAFGGDDFAARLRDNCLSLGMDLSHALTFPESRSNLYLSINNQAGELMAGAADMPLADRIDTEYLRREIRFINRAEALVCDTNLSEEALAFVLEQAEIPVFLDTVSAVKAQRIARVLAKPCEQIRLYCLKMNRQEAQAIQDLWGIGEIDLPGEMHRRGVFRVFLTEGADGVLVSEKGQKAVHLPAEAVPVCNVSGAGDAFFAGLIHAFSLGKDCLESARIGLRAASLTLRSSSAVRDDLKSLL